MENGTPTHTPSLAQQQQQQNNDSDGGNNSGDPSGFLGEIVNSPVTVKLNSGVVYRGAFSFHSPSASFACAVLCLFSTSEFGVLKCFFLLGGVKGM